MPATHGFAVTSATAAGPALHFCVPRRSLVAVRRVIDGPTPQVKGPLDRREIGGEIDIAEAEVVAAGIGVRNLGQRIGHARQVDHRNDRPGDDIPVAEAERDHRLDVEDVGGVIVRAGAEERIVLQRQADHGGDRVLCRRGEIGMIAPASRIVFLSQRRATACQHGGGKSRSGNEKASPTRDDAVVVLRSGQLHHLVAFVPRAGYSRPERNPLPSGFATQPSRQFTA